LAFHRCALCRPGLLGRPHCGAVSSSTLTLPNKPASVAGLADDASVSVFSGQVSYSVPINLPGGRGGFAPSVSLTYSGELGNSFLGIGWTLGRIAIQRSTREGVPSYGSGDTFEIVGVGGGRLVPDDKRPGVYWVEGQGDSVRVEYVAPGWRVHDGKGTLYILGMSEEARVQEGAKVYAWNVQEVRDITRRQGIHFKYERSGNNLYLKRITWGPQAGDKGYRLDVQLEPRPDIVTSWRSGFEMKMDRRVAALEVESFGQRLRRYELTYEDEQISQPAVRLSRLKRVVVSGLVTSAGELELPPLDFGYVANTPATVTQLHDTSYWQLNERGTSFFDVDGDGMADLLRLEQGNHVWKKNLGGRFSSPRPLPGVGDVDLEAVRLMDLDGDARPELVRIVDDTWRVYSLDGSGNDWRWKPRGQWPGTGTVPLKGAGVVFADINGDGSTDVIEGAAGTIGIRFDSRAGGLSPIVRRPQISAEDSDVEVGAPGVRFADINGDNIADVTYLTDAFAKMWLGRGDGTFALYNRVSYPWQSQRRAAEVQGTRLQLIDEILQSGWGL